MKDIKNFDDKYRKEYVDYLSENGVDSKLVNDFKESKISSDELSLAIVQNNLDVMTYHVFTKKLNINDILS